MVSGSWSSPESWPTFAVKLQRGQLSSGDMKCSFLQMQLHPDNSNITRDAAEEGNAPHNQFHLRSYYDLSDDLELDFSLNYVDNLPAGDINHYIRFDARLGWHIAENTELSVVGQNLFDKRHPEFGAEAGQTSTEAERGLYIKLTHRF